MQIKTTMRYYLTLVRMAIIKTSINHKCWRGCGERGMLLHCWNINEYSHCEEHYGGFLEKLGIKLSYDPAFQYWA